MYCIIVCAYKYAKLKVDDISINLQEKEMKALMMLLQHDYQSEQLRRSDYFDHDYFYSNSLVS